MGLPFRVRGWIALALSRVAEHYLVSKHEIVPDEKVQEVLAKFGAANTDRFPRIAKDDPAAAEIGAKRGDLIKISRHSPTAGKTIYFRVVG